MTPLATTRTLSTSPRTVNPLTRMAMAAWASRRKDLSLFFTYSGVPGAVMSRMPMTMKIHCERPTMAWT